MNGLLLCVYCCVNHVGNYCNVQRCYMNVAGPDEKPSVSLLFCIEWNRNRNRNSARTPVAQGFVWEHTGTLQIKSFLSSSTPVTSSTHFSSLTKLACLNSIYLSLLVYCFLSLFLHCNLPPSNCVQPCALRNNREVFSLYWNALKSCHGFLLNIRR